VNKGQLVEVNMEIIMERDEDGVVTLPGCMLKIPKDMSALAVLGINKPINYGKYAKDGWIYVGGKRIKKWFQNVHDVTIWGPILKDIPKLEARMWKVRDQWDKYAKEKWRPAFDKVVEVKEAHARTTHLKDNKWWLYTSHSYINTDYPSIRFDWVDPPDEPKNHKIGQAYYEADNKLMRYGGYVHKFHRVLEIAIERYLMEHHKPEKSGINMHLEINGRGYWYVSYYVNSHVLWWKKISWPEEETIKVVL
jgi:hypothetical protein